MVESLPADDAGAQKRRSTRIVQAVPITVSGVDALGQPFKERTTTVMVNCHGCKYQSKHYVPKNSAVTLEIPRTEPSQAPRSISGRVIWVQRPRAVRELFQIGVEFETAGNVWGIAFPPDDWFPVPGEEPVAQAPAQATPSTVKPIVPPSGATEIAANAANAPAQISASPAGPPAENKIHVVPPSTSVQEAQLAAARQTAKMVAEAKETLDKSMRRGAQTAINEEMVVVRQQLDAQLHEAVERAIKLSMERVSESAVKRVVQQAAERTAAIVEEARKAGDVSAANLDAKIRAAVDGAVSQAAEQAAQQAAQQATAQNLKQAVEEAVERVVSQREAATPSLSILSSPEAAQQHLEGWKKNLEDAAQSVRSQTISQAEADAAAARHRWQHEFESALNGASQDISAKVSEASQNALAQAESEIAARQSGVRESLDAAIAEAQTRIESLGSGLDQKKAAAEQARAQMEDATRAATEQQRALTENLKAQVQESGRSVLDALNAGMQQHHAALENTKAQIEEAGRATLESINVGIQEHRSAVENAKAQVDEAARTTVDDARRKMDEMLAAQEAEAARRAGQVITERLQGIEPVLQNATQQTIERFSTQIDQAVGPKIEAAQKAAGELARARDEASALQARIREELKHAFEQATELEAGVREQAQKVSEQSAQAEAAVRAAVQQASQQAVQESLERLRQESGKLPAEFEQTCRAVLTKLEEELDQKSTESQHETYEALQKAADWYQKKAQTTMQTALEKAVDQSTTTLRSRAAEISSLAASELDHYRRTYVEHSQGEIEEAARAVVERERGRMGESAEIAHAAFNDRVQHVTNASMQRLEEASRQALEKARSDIEYTRENSLADFEKTMQQRMAQGVEQAQMALQSQLGPVIEAWEAKRQAEQRAWLEQVKKSADESIEQYKARLENASNSWLLASATTLGQHSQAVLDTLAKAAEKRMRESIADVLAGMGDTLKDRLLGISTQFGPDDEDDELPPKKK